MERLRWIVAIGVAVLIAVPASAGATLVFVRHPLKPLVWVAADDGSSQHRLTAGTSPHVSPDGQMVAYLRIRRSGAYRPELMVVPADGSASPRRLLANWSQSWIFDWSPDSGTIATVRGPELGAKRLVLIDVASGAQRTVAMGYFSGVSFAPQGGQLVYGRSASERYPPHSDIYRFDLSGGGTVRLTRDHRSLSPLWGPREIVFVKLLGADRRRYGPKNELYLMQPGGEAEHRLTHTGVGALLQGLTPTQWSADGSRLLAEFGGQDTSYAVTVNPRTGAQRPVGKAGERGLVGAALSADGELVLGATGGFEPGPNHDVVSVPYGGGKTRILARNAFEPDWSR
jgi:Tol biopolymer transport system component